MQKNKIKPGYYLLDNSALIKVDLKDSSSYAIELLYTNPNFTLNLGSAGTVLEFQKFESILEMFEADLVEVDNTKGDVVGLIYGNG